MSPLLWNLHSGESLKRCKTHHLPFDCSESSLRMQAVCLYFGKTFGRLKVADKGIHRTRAITLNYLFSEYSLTESEQGYVVALCLPNLPHEEHRLVAYGKCVLPTKSLKGLAQWALGISGNIGSVHLKQKREEQSVPQMPGKEVSLLVGITSERLRPVIREYCWY